MELI
jgi:hypothetical protein